MERVFRPSRDYWLAYEGIVSSWTILIGMMAFLTQTEDDRILWRFSPALGCLLGIGAVYLSAAAIYAILVYRRKRLIVGAEEVRLHGPLFVRALRFADIREARWLWLRERPQPYGLRLHTATKKLSLTFIHYTARGAQGELIELLRSRLSHVIRQDWEAVPAVREGRASPWSPPIFTIGRSARMLGCVVPAAALLGGALGLLLSIQLPRGAAWWADVVHRGEMGEIIKIPGAAEWPWYGSLPLDWSVGYGLAGLIVGILFLSFFRGLEWAGWKWRIVQGRRANRAA